MRMKVTEYLRQADRPLISFEIIPPKRGGHIQQIIDLIEKLTKSVLFPSLNSNYSPLIGYFLQYDSEYIYQKVSSPFFFFSHPCLNISKSCSFFNLVVTPSDQHQKLYNRAFAAL